MSAVNDETGDPALAGVAKPPFTGYTNTTNIGGLDEDVYRLQIGTGTRTISVLPDLFKAIIFDEAGGVQSGAIEENIISQAYISEKVVRSDGSVRYQEVGTGVIKEDLVAGQQYGRISFIGVDLIPHFTQISFEAKSQRKVVISNINGNEISDDYTGEYYLFVTSNPSGFLSGLSGVPEAPTRYLITDGSPSGQRSAVWGNWVQTITSGSPADVDPLKQAVDTLTNVVDKIEVLFDANELYGAALRASAKITEKSLSQLSAGKVNLLQQIVENTSDGPSLGNWSTELKLSDEISSSSAATYAKNIGTALTVVGAGFDAYQKYQETGDLVAALRTGSVGLFAGLVSGEAGFIIGTGVTIAATTLVGGAGLPVIIGLAAGAYATVKIDAAIRASVNWGDGYIYRKIGEINSPLANELVSENYHLIAPLAASSATVGLDIGDEPPQPSWSFDPVSGVFTWLNQATIEKLHEVETLIGIAAVPDGLNLVGDQFVGVINDYLNGSSADDIISGLSGDDIILGADGSDLLSGGSGGDIIFGGAGGDTLRGNDGDDMLVGGEGSDVLDGGLGNDVAAFGGPRSSYVVVGNKGQANISGPIDGSDILIDIEILRFADGDYEWRGNALVPIAPAPTFALFRADTAALRAAEASDNRTFIDVDALANGGFSVKWLADSDGDGEADALVAQAFTSAGVRDGAPLVVQQAQLAGTTPTATLELRAIAADPAAGGNQIVAYQLDNPLHFQNTTLFGTGSTQFVSVVGQPSRFFVSDPALNYSLIGFDANGNTLTIPVVVQNGMIAVTQAHLDQFAYDARVGLSVTGLSFGTVLSVDYEAEAIWRYGANAPLTSASFNIPVIGGTGLQQFPTFTGIISSPKGRIEAFDIDNYTPAPQTGQGVPSPYFSMIIRPEVGLDLQQKLGLTVGTPLQRGGYTLTATADGRIIVDGPTTGEFAASLVPDANGVINVPTFILNAIGSADASISLAINFLAANTAVTGSISYRQPTIVEEGVFLDHFSNNAAPIIALPMQTLSALEGMATSVRVIANDPDGDQLSFVSSVPAHGSVTYQDNGRFSYTPAAGYIGADSFIVTVGDGNGGNATQTVNLTVVQVPSSSAGRLFAGDGFKGQIGGSGSVFGSLGFQDITVLDEVGNLAFDPSFNRGGDIIRLSGNAANWQVARVGSTALLTDGDTFLTIPLGSVGLAVVFGDGARTLRVDGSAIKIGGQDFASALETITASAEALTLPTGLIPEAQARLFVAAGASASVGGKVEIFGTTAAEHVSLHSGAITLDPSFNRGGDVIEVGQSAAAFMASRVGSTIFLDSITTDIRVPIGSAGATLDFGSGDVRELIFDAAAASIRVGEQLIGFTPVMLSQFA